MLASIRAGPIRGRMESQRMRMPARRDVDLVFPKASRAGTVYPLKSTNDADEVLKRKLDGILAGVHASTRRQDAKVLRVLHVSRAAYTHNTQTRKPRCGRLDLDLLWESQPLMGSKASMASVDMLTSEPVQGIARVTLNTTGSCDRVSVSDVQLLAKDDDDAPRMPSSEPTPPDVLLAVESMDGMIMQRLNDFMWEVEQSQDFPLASMECEDDEDEAECKPAARG